MQINTMLYLGVIVFLIWLFFPDIKRGFRSPKVDFELSNKQEDYRKIGKFIIDCNKENDLNTAMQLILIFIKEYPEATVLAADLQKMWETKQSELLQLN